jgi:hypothetical protein
MTKDEALAFDLALEALRPFSTPNWAGTGVDKANEAITAITAIKQARLAPVQEPAEVLGHNGWGFPIKAAAPVQEDWGPGPHEYHSLTAAPVQEPVAWRYRGILHDFDPSDWAEGPVTPLYTIPPAAQRQWVRLTNEEIAQIYLVNTDKPLKADWLFARAIEAKLKEKNT